MKNYDEFKKQLGSGEFFDGDNDAGDLFWGNIGAGILPYCTKTKKFLVGFRSAYVNEPHRWGVWGGKLDEGVENLSQIKNVAIRELEEETQYSGEIRLIDSHIFKAPSGNFTYYNFIGVVPNEFKPVLDWENEDYRWVSFDELMDIEPKHFGLIELIENEKEQLKKLG